MQDLQEDLKCLSGRKIEKAIAGIGSMIDFTFSNFEKDNLEQWGIWIQDASWRSQENDQNILDDKFIDKDAFASAIGRFRNRKLSSTVFDTLTFDLTLIFENDLNIIISGARELKGDRSGWLLFTPDSHAFSVAPRGVIDFRRSDQS